MPELDRSKFVDAADIDALVAGERVVFLDVVKAIRTPKERHADGTGAPFVSLP
jgi:hypothetical protein